MHRSAARHAHVASDGRIGMLAVDDEVMTFGLAADRFQYGVIKLPISLAGTQRPAQIGGIASGPSTYTRCRYR